MFTRWQDNSLSLFVIAKLDKASWSICSDVPQVLDGQLLRPNKLLNEMVLKCVILLRFVARLKCDLLNIMSQSVIHIYPPCGLSEIWLVPREILYLFVVFEAPRGLAHIDMSDLMCVFCPFYILSQNSEVIIHFPLLLSQTVVHFTPYYELTAVAMFRSWVTDILPSYFYESLHDCLPYCVYIVQNLTVASLNLSSEMVYKCEQINIDSPSSSRLTMLLKLTAVSMNTSA